MTLCVQANRFPFLLFLTSAGFASRRPGPAAYLVMPCRRTCCDCIEAKSRARDQPGAVAAERRNARRREPPSIPVPASGSGEPVQPQGFPSAMLAYTYLLGSPAGGTRIFIYDSQGWERKGSHQSHEVCPTEVGRRAPRRLMDCSLPPLPVRGLVDLFSRTASRGAPRGGHRRRGPASSRALPRAD